MPEAKASWIRFSEHVLNWIYPPQCALCRRMGTPAVCEVCESEMRPLSAFENDATDGVLSFRLSAYAYEGRAGQAVRRLKYSRSTSLARFMAEAVRTLACETDVADGRVIVPVPIHWTRRCARGFNQAELLCEAFPKESVNRNLLVRAKATPPQAGLKAAQRRRNLTGAFKALGGADGLRILLVDDVLTTGHTGTECARALLAAGALEVGLITFAAEL